MGFHQVEVESRVRKDGAFGPLRLFQRCQGEGRAPPALFENAVDSIEKKEKPLFFREGQWRR